MCTLIRKDQTLSAGLQSLVSGPAVHIITTPTSTLKTGGKAEKSSNLLRLLSPRNTVNYLARNITYLLDYFRGDNKRVVTPRLSGVPANGDRTSQTHKLKEREREA